MSEHADRYDQPLTYNPRAPPSLPSIHDLEFGLRRCPEPTCPKLFRNSDFCGEHERFSSTSLQISEYQLPQDSFSKIAPMQRHVPQSMPSPVLSMGDTSSDSEPMYTPNVSRATSPISLIHAANAASHQRRRSSKVAARRGSRRGSEQLDGRSDQDKKVKKMEKEKACRSQQGNVLSRTEDFFRVYCNWERREQSGGNGNGAGLTANKINILRAMEVTLQLFLHKGRCDAMLRGPRAVLEWEREMQQLLTSAPDGIPFEHTFLSGSEEPCSHLNPKSKECTTHGTADWRDCRILQSRARFEEQQAQWIEANIPRDQQEKWRRANL